VKNSKFIAEIFPVENQIAAREKLLSVKKKYADATHVVHAFVAGKKCETCGMSDDGEPGGTAGRPILDVLKGSGLTDVLLTVTRYFGGTLLGTGGLVRAYSDAAKEVLKISRTEEFVEKENFSFSADYAGYEIIRRIFSRYGISNLREEFLSEVFVRGEIFSSQKKEFISEIKNLSKGKISCT
jgi:uncharacterized YigZ family protein